MRRPFALLARRESVCWTEPRRAMGESRSSAGLEEAHPGCRGLRGRGEAFGRARCPACHAELLARSARGVSPPPAGGRRPAFPLSGPAAPGLRPPRPRPRAAAGGEFLVATSCKERGMCPSCGAKRAAVFAAFLHDEVLEPVARVIAHVPQQRLHMVRYVGHYSNSPTAAETWLRPRPKEEAMSHPLTVGGRGGREGECEQRGPRAPAQGPRHRARHHTSPRRARRPDLRRAPREEMCLGSPSPQGVRLHSPDLVPHVAARCGSSA